MSRSGHVESARHPDGQQEEHAPLVSSIGEWSRRAGRLVRPSGSLLSPVRLLSMYVLLSLSFLAGFAYHSWRCSGVDSTVHTQPLPASSTFTAAAAAVSHRPASFLTTSSELTDSYSSFYCIGDGGRLDTQSHRSCRFRNLCYERSTADWLFYQDPATEGQVPVLLDDGRLITEFPPTFLYLRSQGYAKDTVFWSPVQRYAAMPRASVVPRNRPDRADVYLLYYPFFPGNIGHIIGDDLFPLFCLMRSFDVLTSDARMLMVSQLNHTSKYRPHPQARTEAAADAHSGPVHTASRSRDRLRPRHYSGCA